MGFDLLFFVEVSLAGLGSGALLALVGLAFVLVYKSTHVINLTIREMMRIAAYLFFTFAGGLALPAWAAIALALACGGLLGALIERAMIRPMLGESPISVFMITIGLGSVLVGAAEIAWGATPTQLPDFLGAAPVFIGPAYLSRKVAIGFAVASIVIAGAVLAFRFWRGGVALRATASDQGAAYACGINVPLVFSAAWILAGVATAGAGILVGAIGGIAPTMGAFGLSALVVVILGGLDSLAGALIGGMIVGLVEAWLGTWLGGEYKILGTFGLLVAALMIRPYGLFGTVEIERL
jgi:branched-chain amino acid transport system permease protein